MTYLYEKNNNFTIDQKMKVLNEIKDDYIVISASAGMLERNIPDNILKDIYYLLFLQHERGLNHNRGI